MRKIVVFLATGFGLGLVPFAPGTAGSILGLGLAMSFCMMGLWWQIPLAIVLSVIAIPICGVAEEYYGKQDDRRIVADEILTFPLCLLGIPWMEHPTILIIAFVMNRILDIIKPPPARQAQNLYGGIGIVMDDVFSSLYALGINWLVFRLIY